MRKSNLSDIRVFYLRDESNHPVACVASLREPQATRVALSQCSPKDSFEKKVGRLKAIGRLKGKESFSVPHTDGTSIKWEILSTLFRIPPPSVITPRTMEALRFAWGKLLFRECTAFHAPQTKGIELLQGEKIV